MTELLLENIELVVSHYVATDEYTIIIEGPVDAITAATLSDEYKTKKDMLIVLTDSPLEYKCRHCDIEIVISKITPVKIKNGFNCGVCGNKMELIPNE